MGETSSIVSRRPPFSVSTSHSNERRWISMRFGSSSEVPRRAKLRRWRGASTGAKTAAPSERSGEGKAGARARPAKIAQRRTPLRGAWNGRHGPRPEAPRYVAERFQRDGCGYWPSARLPASAGFANVFGFAAIKYARAAADLPPRLTGRMTGDRRHSPPRLRALEMIEERAL